jgi:iron complex transport system permease protein
MRRVIQERSRLKNRLTRVLLVLSTTTLVCFCLYLVLGGSIGYSPVTVFGAIFNPANADEQVRVVIWEIRLPRAIACIFVGLILATVGSVFQALFRNPLAEPYVLGVASGAGAAGAMGVLLGLSTLFWGLGIMALAFGGGMGTLMLVLALSRRAGQVEVVTLLLSGVVIGAMLSAIMTLILLFAGQDTNRVLRWLLGSMSPMFWNRVLILAIVAVVGVVFLAFHAKVLNAMAVSEPFSKSIGIDPSNIRARMLIAGTAMTAVCVGAVGIIGFLGLVAPHIARRAFDVDWRISLPAAALLGASLLLLADLLAIRLLSPIELPIGAVMAALGAPILLWLLRYSKREATLG